MTKGDLSISKLTRGAPGAQTGPRINEQIKAPKIRLLDENGEMLGVVSPDEGIERAREVGLDLVEVSPNAEPPVCKVMDYGKYKYEEQKRKAEQKKKQKVIEVKEIQLRPGIDEHDYQVKLRNARKFIEKGDKLKVCMRFRGREMTHQELGMAVLKRVKEDLGEDVKVELEPKIEGRRMIMVLTPAK